jgi:hypothetical protein
MATHYVKITNKIIADSNCICKIACYLLIFSLFLYACSKENTGNSKVVTELIQNIKSQNPNCACNPLINQYSWRNKIVYVASYKEANCDWVPVFYDSDGQEFNMAAGYTYAQFLQESMFINNVWTCK